MFDELLYGIMLSYGALFPVVNPLSGSLLFNSITHSLDFPTKKKLAFKIALNTFFLLLGVLLVGTWVLKLFGIQIPIVQIAGGAIVATRGWMIMNTGTRPNATSPDSIIDYSSAMQASFFPLTLPMTAGPGSIATAITLGAEAQAMIGRLHIFAGYLGSAIGIFLAAATVFFSYHYAGYLIKQLGQNGRMVIMKLTSFITLCIGLMIVWKGVQGLISLYIH